MLFADLQRQAWEGAEAQGHHLTLVIMPLREATMVRLALLHTEVQELYEAPSGEHAEELADIIIRIGDLTYAIGLILPGEIHDHEGPRDTIICLDVACLELHNMIATITQLVKRNGITQSSHVILAGFFTTGIAMVEQLANAQFSRISLAAAVQAKLAKNMQRPYQFGTPWEAETT